MNPLRHTGQGSHSGETKHKHKSDDDKTVRGGGGDDVYVYVQLLPGTDRVASSWDGENHFRVGASPFWGCGGLIICTWGSLRGWQSQAGAEVGTEGMWSLPGARLSWCHLQQPGHPTCCQLNTGRGQAFWEEKAPRSAPRVTAEPHVWTGGQVIGFIVRDTCQLDECNLHLVTEVPPCAQTLPSLDFTP